MTINSLEDLVDQQAERIKELEDADAMLREIEKIIPRNDAHRDYAETVQLFVEQSSRTASACEIFKENSSHCAKEFEAKLAAQKRIKELEEMLKPAADTNYRLIQQNSDVVLDVRNLRSAIGTMVPSCLRVLLRLLPAENEIDRQMTEAVLKRVEAAMDATEHYCAVQETIVVENAASIQVVNNG
mgnify:FL=1